MEAGVGARRMAEVVLSGRLIRVFSEVFISPSWMRIWRSQRAARSSSCVTMMRVIPDFLLRWNSRSIIFSLVRESKLPVGSSAKITSGILTMARAIQTRCFSPPDRFLALAVLLWYKSTTFNAVLAIFLAFLRRAWAMRRGCKTLFMTESLSFM